MSAHDAVVSLLAPLPVALGVWFGVFIVGIILLSFYLSIFDDWMGQ
jgi:hypothetical protein